MAFKNEGLVSSALLDFMSLILLKVNVPCTLTLYLLARARKIFSKTVLHRCFSCHPINHEN